MNNTSNDPAKTVLNNQSDQSNPDNYEQGDDGDITLVQN